SPDRGPAPPRRPASRAVATEGTDSMASIASDPADVIVGVDTHKDQHVAVALDGLGRPLGERVVSDARAPSAPADVSVGVDTHKDQHVAVALDGLGRRLGERFVSAAPAGYADLLA